MQLSDQASERRVVDVHALEAFADLLFALDSGEAATGLPKEVGNPVAGLCGHLNQVRSPRFQISEPENLSVMRRKPAAMCRLGG